MKNNSNQEDSTKWKPESIRANEVEHLRKFHLIVRQFAERLAQRIDSKQEKSGQDNRLMPLPWLYSESEENPEALSQFDISKTNISQLLVLNYASNIPFRCYLGFLSTQEDQFVQAIATSAFPNFDVISANASLTKLNSSNQKEYDEMLKQFGTTRVISGFITSFIQDKDIKRIIKELPFNVCITAIKRSFRTCRDSIARQGYGAVEETPEKSVINYWSKGLLKNFGYAN